MGLAKRDADDAGRLAAPMEPAADALQLDTSMLDADAAFTQAVVLTGDRVSAG